MTTESRTILVADDEPLFRNAVADALRARSPRYLVREAGNGIEATAALDRESFDCIVTDLRMPILDGFGVLLAIHNRRLTTPVVVVSAHGDSQVRGRVAELGAIRYFDKPVDLASLVSTVERLVAGERSHIEGVTLAGLLQLLEMEQKTATVWVRSERGHAGRLLLQDGMLVDAFAGSERGVGAARKLLAWRNAVLDLAGHGRLDAPESEPIPLTPLLLEAARLRDEAEEYSARSLRGEEDTPVTVEETDVTQKPERMIIMNIEQSMQAAMEINGCVGVCLVDFESGMTLGSKGSGILDLDVAAAGNTEVVRAKLRTMKALRLDDTIEDILITLSSQYHILRPLRKMPNLFLYVALDRQKANLAMARIKAGQIETELKI